ncbi:MAG: hypothetical protein JXQ93_04100 [Flavobacteriaceae bacterium]
MNNYKKFILSIIVLFLSASLFSQTKKDTLHILFVGNSYTYFQEMPKMLSAFSKNTQTKITTQMSAPGGARLREHWLGQRGMKTKEIIKNGAFDIVVLQGQSMAALKRPDTLKKYSKLFSDYIKKHNAEPYFYMTWARKKTPERQKDITRVYTEIATANKATLVPVGNAWAMAKKLRPNISLYTPDGSHPNQLGAYLTASVFAASLLHELPSKIDHSTFLIKKKDGEFCMEIAKQFSSKK